MSVLSEEQRHQAWVPQKHPSDALHLETSEPTPSHAIVPGHPGRSIFSEKGVPRALAPEGLGCALHDRGSDADTCT